MRFYNTYGDFYVLKHLLEGRCSCTSPEKAVRLSPLQPETCNQKLEICNQNPFHPRISPLPTGEGVQGVGLEP